MGFFWSAYFQSSLFFGGGGETQTQTTRAGERGREGRYVGSSCRLFDLAQEVNGPIEGPKAVPVILTSHTSKLALLFLAFPYCQKRESR